jgi:hypothetical protein
MNTSRYTHKNKLNRSEDAVLAYLTKNFDKIKVIWDSLTSAQSDISSLTSSVETLDENKSKALESEATASDLLVGTLRYREEATDSFLECCMRTADETYEWVVVKTNSWAE